MGGVSRVRRASGLPSIAGILPRCCELRVGAIKATYAPQQDLHLIRSRATPLAQCPCQAQQERSPGMWGRGLFCVPAQTAKNRLHSILGASTYAIITTAERIQTLAVNN
jgi:hypothetical protein